VATEGIKTEREYLALINRERITVNWVRPDSSNPMGVLKAMKRHIEKEPLRRGDEAWIVIDRDHWAETELNDVASWANSQPNHGMALSNPKFEYWMLLHFEDAKGVSTSYEIKNKLRQYLPSYVKQVAPSDFSEENIARAIVRAKSQDDNTHDWPKSPGQTTVYRLIERMLEA
jgi:hypothetical protein